MRGQLNFLTVGSDPDILVVLLVVVRLSSDNGFVGTGVDLKGNKFTCAILTYEYENIREVLYFCYLCSMNGL